MKEKFRYYEIKTGCEKNRLIFMDEAWSVVQLSRTQSVLKTDLNRQFSSVRNGKLKKIPSKELVELVPFLEKVDQKTVALAKPFYDTLSLYPHKAQISKEFNSSAGINN